MTKPTVIEHRTNIRGLLSEATAKYWTDAEVDANLANSLYVLSGYVTKLAKVNKTGLLVGDTLIDMVADCPAEAVVEIVPTALSPVTEFRARGTVLVLKAAIGATGADFYYRAAYTHDGTNTDWYPPFYRGAVVLLAAAMCITGATFETSVVDSLKATAMGTTSYRWFDTAIAIMSGKQASASTYGRSI